MTQNAFTFNQFDAEAYFERRLAEHGRAISVGRTDPAERRERIRSAILECELGSTVMGKRTGGGAETYAQAFERFYGEPLKPKRKGTRR